MPEYLITFIMILVAFWLGWRIRTAVLMYHISEDPDKMISILNKIKEINAKGESKDKSEVTPNGDVKIEHHHGHVYLFESETDKFLAQGETIADAIAIMDKRFPGQFALKVTIPDSHSA